MQTHSIQFGKPATHAHTHEFSGAHLQNIGGRYVAPRTKSTGDKQHDALVNQTEKWVSQTFYGEMLKQMRNSPFKSKILDGGDGGKAFTEMFDQNLADKMSKGAGHKLVDSIVNSIEHPRVAGKAYAAQVKKPVAPAIDLIHNTGLRPMRPMFGNERTSAPSAAVRSSHKPVLRERSKQAAVHHYPAIKPQPLSPTLRAKIGALP